MNRKYYASKINTAYVHMFLTVNRPIKTSIKELGEERNTIKHVYTVSEYNPQMAGESPPSLPNLENTVSMLQVVFFQQHVYSAFTDVRILHYLLDIWPLPCYVFSDE